MELSSGRPPKRNRIDEIDVTEWMPNAIDYKESQLILLLEAAERNRRQVQKGEEIAEMVGLSQNRVSEIVGNTKFGEIDNLLSQGRNMDYIARH